LLRQYAWTFAIQLYRCARRRDDDERDIHAIARADRKHERNR